MTSVIAAVDDLMFSSKILTTARQLGIELEVVRMRDDVLRQARGKKPSLLILDLNSTTLDPIGTIAALKGDAELSSIPILGFVSHVDSGVIAAARAAGIDEVLARSAFTARLA